MTAPPIQEQQKQQRPRRPSPPPLGARLREPDSPVLLAKSLPSTATLNALSVLEIGNASMVGAHRRVQSGGLMLAMNVGSSGEDDRDQEGIGVMTVGVLQRCIGSGAKVSVAGCVGVDLKTFEVREEGAGSIDQRKGGVGSGKGNGKGTGIGRQRVDTHHSHDRDVPVQTGMGSKTGTRYHVNVGHLELKKMGKEKGIQWIFIPASAVPTSRQVRTWFAFEADPLVRSAKLEVDDGNGLRNKHEMGFAIGVRGEEERKMVRWWEERFPEYRFMLWPESGHGGDLKIEVEGEGVVGARVLLMLNNQIKTDVLGFSWGTRADVF